MPATACSAGPAAVGGAPPRRGEHGAHPPQRRGPAGRAEPTGLAVERLDEQVAELARRRRLPSARRSARRSCRSDTGSTRPIGPVSSASARSPSSPSAVASSTVSSAAHRGLFGQRRVDDGCMPPAPRRRPGRAASAAPARGTDRTITAICDHGTPSTRCARRSASAISAASACGDAAIRTVTEPGPVLGAAQIARPRRRRAAAARCRVTARPRRVRSDATRVSVIGGRVVAAQQRRDRRRGSRTPPGWGRRR